jgi:hypothetical protein
MLHSYDRYQTDLYQTLFYFRNAPCHRMLTCKFQRGKGHIEVWSFQECCNPLLK